MGGGLSRAYLHVLDVVFDELGGRFECGLAQRIIGEFVSQRDQPLADLFVHSGFRFIF